MPQRRPQSMLSAIAWTSRRVRLQSHITQWQIAERAGVDETTVKRFERGVTWPRQPDELVAAYADWLDLHPRELWQAAVNAWTDDR